MNRLAVGRKQENVVYEDAITFYEAISKCIGQKLDPEKDRIFIDKPDTQSRSSGSHMLYCIINGSRRVALKRCYDNPEFMRRELAIADAKRKLMFSSYNMFKIDGLKLRNTLTKNSCMLTQGWENKPLLVIDFGNPSDIINLSDLTQAQIANIQSFCHSYGSWTAFNRFFGVRDRHGMNFIFIKNTQILHSVDNEEGPLDSTGRFIGVKDIEMTMSQNIQRLIAGANRDLCIQWLRQGFLDGLARIRSIDPSSISMLNANEITLLEQMLAQAPSDLQNNIFF
jgi:hypothetical protein